MKKLSVFILVFISLHCLAQTAETKIGTSGYFVIDCMGNDTLFRSLENADKYTRLELRDNAQRYSYGEFPFCVIPLDIERFVALDTLISNGVGLIDQLSKLSHLSVLSTDGSYIPKLPGLKSLYYSSIGDSLPGNLKYSKELKNLDLVSMGNDLLYFNDYNEQYVYEKFNWYDFFSQIAELRSLESLSIERKEWDYYKTPDTLRILPQAFYDLIELKRLIYTASGLDTISADFSKLSKLHYVHVNANQSFLPEAIYKLADLDSLNTGGMKFPHSEIRMEKLKYLYCTGMHLPLMPALIHLEYYGYTLPKSILSNTTMDSLSVILSHDRNSFVANFNDCLETASKLKSLQSLKIHAYEMGDAIIEPLVTMAPILARMPKLKSFNVFGSPITKQQKMKIEDIYRKLKINFKYISPEY